MTMLDRILYALASPLAREIIDSLEHQPGEWAQCYHLRIGHPREPLDELWCKTLRYWLPFHCGSVSRDMCRGRVYFGKPSRLALRRAIKKWEKNDG